MAPPRGPRKFFNELGRPGLKAFSGVIYEEFLVELRGQRGIRAYTEMKENNAIVGAMLFAVESLLRSVDWRVEPVSERPADLEAADFLTSCMEDMSHTWEDFISEVLSMLPYGWSWFEQVYKVRKGPDRRSPRHKSQFSDGRIGWRKFSIRSQESLVRWEFDKDGGLRGLTQRPPGYFLGDTMNEVTIPVEKSLLFRTTSAKGNPEGRSILRSSYRSYYFAKRIEEIEAVGMERDLAGMPIAYVPIEILAADRDEAADATYDAIKDIVQKVKRDQQEGIMFPNVFDENGNQLYKFELLSTGGRRQFRTGDIIQRYNQQIAMTILADFILLGHENVGSFALSSDKTELFAVALGAWLDTIEEVLNRHAVTRLFELNPDLRSESLPQIRHGDIETPDLTEVSDYIQKLSASGMPIFPDLRVENKLREIADLPEADEEERDQNLLQQQVAAVGGPMDEGGKVTPTPAPQPALPAAIKKLLEDDEVEWRDMTDEEVTDMIEKRSPIRPSYFDGTRWKTLRGRHKWRARSKVVSGNGAGRKEVEVAEVGDEQKG